MHLPELMASGDLRQFRFRPCLGLPLAGLYQRGSCGVGGGTECVFYTMRRYQRWIDYNLVQCPWLSHCSKSNLWTLLTSSADIWCTSKGIDKTRVYMSPDTLIKYHGVDIVYNTSPCQNQYLTAISADLCPVLEPQDCKWKLPVLSRIWTLTNRCSGFHSILRRSLFLIFGIRSTSSQLHSSSATSFFYKYIPVTFTISILEQCRFLFPNFRTTIICRNLSSHKVAYHTVCPNTHHLIHPLPFHPLFHPSTQSTASLLNLHPNPRISHRSKDNSVRTSTFTLATPWIHSSNSTI